MALVEKELKGGTLIKIYTNGQPTSEIKQEINAISARIISYNTQDLKIVFDYEEQGTINFFEGYAGKKPFLVLNINAITNVPDVCHSYEIAKKVLSLLETDVDFEITRSLLDLRIAR